MKKINLKSSKRKKRNTVSSEHHKKKLGQAPGQLIFSGEKKVDEVKGQVYSFNSDVIDFTEDFEVSHFMNGFDDSKINWVNIDGLHNIELLKEVGKRFKLHTLLLEDVMNLNHRPKFEDYGDHIFFTIRMFNGVQDGELDYEQVSFVLGKNYVISFQEKPQDIFNIIRERLTSGLGRMRKKNADYLFYRLIDTIVDYYYFAIEHFAEELETLEEEVMANPDKESLVRLQELKKDLIYLRRSVLPVRESLSSCIRSESQLIRKDTQPYLQDVYDHTIHVVESLESYRDLLSSIKDLHINAISNRMNEVMKVLTIISTIFIPLTFIAGIYGMNFQYMPELGYHYAYPIAWLVMILITLIMIVFFKRKKWL
tara:strand:+ start:4981 stop:6084 length:1104 start_codon:yes stop_codon:yes gene_type:complete